MREIVKCEMCGKTLGIKKNDMAYIKHKGREIVIAPNYGSSCKIYVTCEGCKCQKLIEVSTKSLDFPT